MYYGMTQKIEHDWKTLSLPQTIHILKVAAKNAELIWCNEEETIDDIEFELGYRGWRLLCHIKREYPYTIKYRLISSSPKSVSIKPKDFIQRAIKVLNH